MPSEAEIKEFIDSREVLSKIELSKYIYGYKKNCTRLVEKWWLYTLHTKDLENLYNEKQKRINQANTRPDKQMIIDLLKTDERLKNSGTRKQAEYLKKFYGISTSRCTLKRWRKEICED